MEPGAFLLVFALGYAAAYFIHVADRKGPEDGA